MLALTRLASRRGALARSLAPAARSLHAGAPSRAKVVAVLYPDPVAGYPPVYARDTLPAVTVYPDGFAVPRLKDAQPGTLLGCVSGSLGLQQYLASRGDAYVVTADKDGPDCALEAELADADVIITTPFWPAYMDAGRLERAQKLKLLVTAGVGSDNIDLAAAAAKGVTVAEATHSNSVSVAEHAVMTILALVRNFVPAHLTAVTGGWHVADLAARSYDLERMAVGTVGAGRIGLAVLRRLAPFDVELHYTDRRRLPGSVEQALNLKYHASAEEVRALPVAIALLGSARADQRVFCTRRWCRIATWSPSTRRCTWARSICSTTPCCAACAEARTWSTPLAARSATARPSWLRWRRGTSQAMAAMCGTRSRLLPATRGARCRTTP